MDRNDLILGGTCGLLILILFAVATQTWTSAAEWAQAIGTVLAVVAAIIVGNRQARQYEQAESERVARENKQCAKRAYILVNRLASIFAIIAGNLDRIERADFNQLMGLGRNTIDGLLKTYSIDVFWEETIFRDLHLLDDRPARETTQFLYSVSRYNETVRTLLETQISRIDIRRTETEIRAALAIAQSDLELTAAVITPVATASAVEKPSLLA